MAVWLYCQLKERLFEKLHQKTIFEKKYSMSFTDDIRGLIGRGRTREALEQAAQWVKGKDSTLANDIILLQSQWNQNERSERMGLLSSQEISMYRARINSGLLSLLEDVEKLERKNPASAPAASAYTAGETSERHAGSASDKVKIFISYAREDREWVNKLDKHLAVLKRRYVESWTDSEILPGDSWNEEIRRKLNEADIILLMVSPDFLNSEFIYKEELPLAWSRHQAGNALVIPIILRPSSWELEEYASLQALPRSARPISQWPNEDEAFVDVVNGLRKVIEARLGKK